MTKSYTLIGMSGVGKSTIGKELAKNLNKTFIDLDNVISDKKHQNLQTIINNIGDKEFLKLEASTCLEVTFSNIVLAPGGSLIYSPEAMKYVKEKSTVIYLEDTYDNILNRIPNIQERGIIGLLSDSFEDIYNERLPFYEKYSDLTITCTQKSWASITNEILEKVNHI